MQRFHVQRLMFGWSLFCLLVTSSVGQESGPKVSVLLAGLQQPETVLLRPVKKNPYDLLILEAGAGQVIKFTTDKLDQKAVVVQKLPRAKQSPELSPGMVFIDQFTLAIGAVDQGPGKDQIAIFKLDDTKPDPLEWSNSSAQVGPFAPNKDSQTGEGHFHQLLFYNEALWIVGQGDPAQNWLSRAISTTAKFGDIKPLIALSGQHHAGQASTLTVSPRGEIVVASVAGNDKTSKSYLLFFHPADGRLLLKLEHSVAGIQTLAYHKLSKQQPYLYALVSQADDPAQSGIYRLDVKLQDGRQTIVPKLLIALPDPRSMVMSEEGDFYVTIRGKHPQSQDQAAGQLLKITGL
jgi:hypothetical protein